ncbi:MAG: DUF418 domain-containing protein [Paraglaciecola sp.]|nr:DUF418 domain-containing protein [Paraglaciecola sp.]
MTPAPEIIAQPHATDTPIIELEPISAVKRIDAMDILRGFALIGILMMNIEWFNRPISELGSFNSALSGIDHAVGWLIRCFVEGKFYKLFALLFGMGFAVMLNSAIEKSRPFGAWFVRRMIVLFIIGLLHLVFLWEGDILHDYAFAGLMLLLLVYLLRTKRLQKYNHPNTFLKLGLWWLLAPMLIGMFVGIGFSVSHDKESLRSQWQESQHVQTLVEQLEEQTLLANAVEQTEHFATDNEPEDFGSIASTPIDEQDSDTQASETNESTQQALSGVDSAADLTPAQEAQEIVDFYKENRQAVEKEQTTLKQGDYWQVTEYRAEKAIEHLLLTPAFTFGMLLPLFILGYWLISAGIMANYQQHRLLFIGLRRIGLGVGLFTTVAGLIISSHPASEQLGLFELVGGFLFAVGQLFMTAGYLGLIMSLLLVERWHQILSHVAPLGRMALTNYLMHSLILTSLFYGYAGGLYGEVGRAPQMLIVIAIIVVQIPLSRWWLRSYHFGPLEWLWRSLTYKKWQAFKIQ